MLKKLSLAAVALIGAVGIAYAGGAFNGFPIVGDPGSDICLSYGNNSVCNQYSPAGPTNVNPQSTFPADTNIPNVGGTGAGSATVNIPAGMTGATVLDNAPLTGASITVPTGTAKLILNPAGTIAALTVLLPAPTTTISGNVWSLNDGQEFFIYSSQTVTALTVTPYSGTTLTPTITTVTAAAPVKLIYNKAALAWQTF